METKDYITKATALLKRLEKLQAPKSFTDDGEYRDIEKEFVHLVFFFNADMPLYKEITSKPADSLGVLNQRTLPDYIKKFIYYLNEFCM